MVQKDILLTINDEELRFRVCLVCDRVLREPFGINLNELVLDPLDMRGSLIEFLNKNGGVNGKWSNKQGQETSFR